MEEGEGFDFYDLLFFLYASYKNEEFFSFYKDEEKRVTDWLFLLVYAFVYLDILLRSYPNAYKYSNLYEIFQINLYNYFIKICITSRFLTHFKIIVKVSIY